MAQIITSKNITLALSLSVAMVVLFVLVGWTLHIASLKGVFRGLVAMKANTAMGLLLCSVSLAFLSREKTGTKVRVWTILSSVLVISIGALTIFEDISHLDLNIDQWLFKERGVTVDNEASRSGRMSPSTAIVF